VQAHLRLLQREKLEARRNGELHATVRRLNNKLIERNEAERRLLQLQHAQAAHRAFETSLHRKIFEAQTFKSACRRQELAIARMEDLLAQLRGVRMATRRQAGPMAFLQTAS
jgi:hypothetical protein